MSLEHIYNPKEIESMREDAYWLAQHYLKAKDYKLTGEESVARIVMDVELLTQSILQTYITAGISGTEMHEHFKGNVYKIE